VEYKSNLLFIMYGHAPYEDVSVYIYDIYDGGPMRLYYYNIV